MNILIKTLAVAATGARLSTSVQCGTSRVSVY